MNTPLEQKFKIIAAVQFISATALILFWIGYYLVLGLEMEQPAFYSDYTSVFPFPDGLLALMMIGAGLLVLQQIKAGQLLTVIVAVALVFLGISGFRMELEGGVVLISMVSMLKSGFINLWCIVFGLYFLLKLKGKKEKAPSS